LDVAQLFSSARTADVTGAWEPVLLDPRAAPDRDRLRDLAEQGAVRFVHDTIDAQLRDLLATRHPERKLADAELADLVAAHLAGASPWAYGCWCFFPWSGRLVHLLPEHEFRELRTSANRNRITTAEQQRLRELRIGVVGLSVGHSTALTLAQEEVGGEYRLADFDVLDPSNLNRLRAGVHDIGLNKAVHAARGIYEINPFARVVLFMDGISEQNVDAFLTAGGALDLLYEECDSLHIKILVRERARAHRIPVVMETSDRGMLDVERFDREPDRPLLHGLVGDVRAEDVRGLTNYQKVPVILRMVGARTASGRMVASMIDIETTLKTWPQLASAVSLSGAINTDVGRRIALGTFNRSGRFYVDLERLVSDRVDGDVDAGFDCTVRVASSASQALPPPLPDLAASEEDIARAIAAYASLAPSGGNCQPWRFTFSDRRFTVRLDRQRSDTMLDFNHQASRLALGAAIENAVWTARRLGVEPDVRLLPDPDHPDCVAWLDLRRRCEPSAEARAMVDAIGRRVTNRRLGARVPLEAQARSGLLRLADSSGARLDLLDSPHDMAEMADVLAEGDRLRFFCERLHREMIGELRWTPEETERTRDGIDVATLEMTPTDFVGMQLVSSRALIEELIQVEGGHGLGNATRKAVRAASALGRVVVDGQDAASHLRGGRAVQRIWIEANRMGLAFQPLTALVYLFARLENGGADAFAPRERDWLRALRDRYLSLLPVPPAASEMMLFRLAVAGAPTARSLRRPVEEVLTIERASPDGARRDSAASSRARRPDADD